MIFFIDEHIGATLFILEALNVTFGMDEHSYDFSSLRLDAFVFLTIPRELEWFRNSCC